MWRKKAQFVLLTAALGLFASSPGLGQTITSSVVGHVSDASGAAVPGAAIMVTNQGTGISVGTVTDSAGAYSVPNLFAGTYAVTASKEGFETYKVTGIVVQASSTVRQDAALHVGTTRQEITVAGVGTAGAHGFRHLGRNAYGNADRRLAACGAGHRYAAFAGPRRADRLGIFEPPNRRGNPLGWHQLYAQRHRGGRLRQRRCCVFLQPGPGEPSGCQLTPGV